MNKILNRIFFWFVFGVFFTLSIVMIVFGILFIRDVYYSRAEVAAELGCSRHTLWRGLSG